MGNSDVQFGQFCTCASITLKKGENFMFDNVNWSSYLIPIIQALLLLVLAFVVAWIVKALLVKLLGLVLDKAPAAIQVKKVSILNAVGKLIYVIVFILFLPGVFDKLGAGSVSSTIASMADTVLDYIPKILAAVIVIIFGVFLARFLGSLVEGLIASTKADEKAAEALPESKVKLSKFAGTLVRVVLDVFFIVAMLDVLDIYTLSRVGDTIIAYIPRVIASIVILALAWIAASKAKEGILKAAPKAATLGEIAKIAILTLAGFIVLQQLGLGTNIVTILFIFLAGALAVAFGIAFGVGGIDFAKKKLGELDEKIKDETKPE